MKAITRELEVSFKNDLFGLDCFSEVIAHFFEQYVALAIRMVLIVQIVLVVKTDLVKGTVNVT